MGIEPRDRLNRTDRGVEWNGQLKTIREKRVADVIFITYLSWKSDSDSCDPEKSFNTADSHMIRIHSAPRWRTEIDRDPLC